MYTYISLQLSAVITRFDIVRYYINDYNKLEQNINQMMD